MQWNPGRIAGLVHLSPTVFRDERGFFFESYRQDRLSEAGVSVPFVQDNHSRSAKGTLRGLHFQSDPGQAKLIRVVRGRIWDVAVDIRPRSETFGQWEAVELDDETHAQFYIPVGFAHGFCVLSDVAEVCYKVSSFYDANTETGIAWNDPDLAIDWPIEDPTLSERDRNAPSFASLKTRKSSDGGS